MAAAGRPPRLDSQRHARPPSAAAPPAAVPVPRRRAVEFVAALALVLLLLFAWGLCVNAYRDHHGHYPRSVQPRPRAKTPTQRELYEILAGPVATRELELRCQ